MKTLGIIAEYNPFHNGHKYLISELKKETGADFVVVVMSGDFTQRGCPAAIEKFSRTKMAMFSGADLVLELPIYYSTGSAEFFAQGAVTILDSLGCIDYLGFGSESGDIASMEKIADILVNEDNELSEHIKKNVKSGASYAAARAKALAQILKENDFQKFGASAESHPIDATSNNPESSESLDNIEDIIQSPNDILGIEYIKAIKKLNSSIIPVCIKRKGEGYHSLEVTAASESLSSASAIRKVFFKDESSYTDEDSFTEGTDTSAFPDLSSLYEVMPRDCADIFIEAKKLSLNSFSKLLHYKLLCSQLEGYDKYADVSSDLSDKIKNALPEYTDAISFIMSLKSKDITYSHINRALIHILLGITKDNLNEYTKDKHFTSYARILGLNKEASGLLKAIKNNSRIPVISRLADAYGALSEKEMRLLSETITASNIYDMVLDKKRISEYTKQIVILP